MLIQKLSRMIEYMNDVDSNNSNVDRNQFRYCLFFMRSSDIIFFDSEQLKHKNV